MKFIQYCMISAFLLTNGFAQTVQEDDKAFRLYIFMAEDCPICRYYTPLLSELFESYQNKGVEFIGVFPVSQSSSRTIQEFKEQFQLPFKLIKDVDQRLTRTLEATVTPEVILLNAQDEIVYRGRIDNAYDRPGRRRRVITSHDLQTALDAILSGETPEINKTNPVGCYITLLPKDE